MLDSFSVVDDVSCWHCMADIHTPHSSLQAWMFFPWSSRAIRLICHKISYRICVRTIISLPGVMDSWCEALTVTRCPDTDWRWSAGEHWHFHQESCSEWRLSCLEMLPPTPAIKTPPPSKRSFKPPHHKKPFRFVHAVIYWIKKFLFHFKMYFLQLSVREWRGKLHNHVFFIF